MEKRLKQSVGIDCSKDELAVAFGIMDESYSTIILSNLKVPNTQGGFKKLISWVQKFDDKSVPVHFVVEATGVYHELLSLFLFAQHHTITVMLPNKVKAFTKTLAVKTVNDKVSAQAIAQLGLEKKLEPWQPPNPVYQHMRQLTRERDQLIVEQTQKKNQLHAERAGAWPNKGSIKRIQQILKVINKQILEIEEEIKDLIKCNSELKHKFDIICTIPGVSLLTASVVVAETNGFHQIHNKKQLTSYAGLDVIQKESGTSVRGKTRISKKGNKYLRKCLYFPAFSATRCQPEYKNLYDRICSRTGIKMKGAVAIQRKLLILIYILWKKNETFRHDYHQGKIEERQLTAALTN